MLEFNNRRRLLRRRHCYGDRDGRHGYDLQPTRVSKSEKGWIACWLSNIKLLKIDAELEVVVLISVFWELFKSFPTSRVECNYMTCDGIAQSPSIWPLGSSILGVNKDRNILMIAKLGHNQLIVKSKCSLPKIFRTFEIKLPFSIQALEFLSNLEQRRPQISKLVFSLEPISFLLLFSRLWSFHFCIAVPSFSPRFAFWQASTPESTLLSILISFRFAKLKERAKSIFIRRKKLNL